MKLSLFGLFNSTCTIIHYAMKIKITDIFYFSHTVFSQSNVYFTMTAHYKLN